MSSPQQHFIQVIMSPFWNASTIWPPDVTLTWSSSFAGASSSHRLWTLKGPGAFVFSHAPFNLIQTYCHIYLNAIHILTALHAHFWPGSLSSSLNSFLQQHIWQLYMLRTELKQRPKAGMVFGQFHCIPEEPQIYVCWDFFFFFWNSKDSLLLKEYENSPLIPLFSRQHLCTQMCWWLQARTPLIYFHHFLGWKSSGPWQQNSN